MIEAAEVFSGAVAFDSAESVEIRFFMGADFLELDGEVSDRLFVGFRFLAVAGGALENGAAVGDFGGDDGSRDFGRLNGVVSFSILRATQQDVAVYGSGQFGDEAAVDGHERDGDAVVGAQVHGSGTETDATEADDVFEQMDREFAQASPFAADVDGFSVAGDVGAVDVEVEGVQQMSHTAASSRCFFR